MYDSNLQPVFSEWTAQLQDFEDSAWRGRGTPGPEFAINVIPILQVISPGSFLPLAPLHPSGVLWSLCASFDLTLRVSSASLGALCTGVLPAVVLPFTQADSPSIGSAANHGGPNEVVSGSDAIPVVHFTRYKTPCRGCGRPLLALLDLDLTHAALAEVRQLYGPHAKALRIPYCGTCCCDTSFEDMRDHYPASRRVWYGEVDVATGAFALLGQAASYDGSSIGTASTTPALGAISEPLATGVGPPSTSIGGRFHAYAFNAPGVSYITSSEVDLVLADADPAIQPNSSEWQLWKLAPPRDTMRDPLAVSITNPYGIGGLRRRSPDEEAAICPICKVEMAHFARLPRHLTEKKFISSSSDRPFRAQHDSVNFDAYHVSVCLQCKRIVAWR
jgi:hypothetical protein